MSNIPIDASAELNQQMTLLETSTPAHADVFNERFKQCIENDVANRREIEKKADIAKVKSLTIPSAGWQVAAVGQYSYSITLPVSGITAQDIPSGSITIETEHIAQDCNLAAQCQSGEGIITFYAESVPEAEMTYEYYILKGE